MSVRPTPQPGVMQIAPYVQGKSRLASGAEGAKLSSNESPLGASPEAIAAYRAVAEQLQVYPDGSARMLREAIGEVHALDPERIVVGAGSDELLHLLAQAYVGDGDDAVMSAYGFAMYPIVVQGAGGRMIAAPETDYRTSIDALLAAVTPRTRLVFVANPNNPTGACLDARDLRQLHAGLPPQVLLVIDSAYAEYVTAQDYEAGAALVEGSDNVVMVRTFSKMGLAALRLGWLYGPPAVVDALNRLRGPFNVGVPALAAGAAAVRDRAFTARLRSHNQRWRDWLTASLSSNRLRVLPSQGNFVLVLFADEDGQRAPDAFAALLQNGLVVREMDSYGIPNALRISIGTEPQMRRVVEVLGAFGATGAVD